MRTSGNAPENAAREDSPVPESREELLPSGFSEKKNIDIDIIMSPFLNLSLYQAGYPLISDIRFLSEERDYEDVTIRIFCEYGVFEPLELRTDVLQKGSRISVSAHKS